MKHISNIRCRNCKWWGYFDSGFKAPCHRYPPYPSFAKLSESGGLFINEVGALRAEPAMTHGDWDFCGEFEEGESIKRANIEEDARRRKRDESSKL